LSLNVRDTVTWRARQIAASQRNNSKWAFIDWRRRTFRSLETTLDWLVDFLRSDTVLVVWTDRQKAQTSEGVNTALEKLGFNIEATNVRADGSLVSARRRKLKRKAA
jgi:hypothetical protein